MKHILHTKGFTLVETLVAISILSLSILATFTAVQGGLQSSTTAKDEITAFFLTQEVMEYIKNIRDENALHSISGSGTSWLAGIANLGDPCEFGKVCKLDVSLATLNLTSCGSASVTTSPPNLCPNLKQDTVTGLYGYTGTWPDSIFKREIQLQEIVPNVEIRVVVSLSWTSRGIAKSFQTSQSIFNHQ